MSRVLVVAPHPDDETLGCGGTLLRHKSMGDQIFWLIVTVASQDIGYTSEQIAMRAQEIDTVQRVYGFSSVHQCGFTTTMLDTIPRVEIIKKSGEVFQKIEPDIVYLPSCGDVHTDHHVVFDAVSSCIKWFRYPSVKKALAYETLSETDFDINPVHLCFRPNVFVDISPFLEKKIQIMKIYNSEMGAFPFPRSEEAIRAQAALRGIASGFKAAEAFVLLKEIMP